MRVQLNTRGMTLIEMIVTVAIIGIIATVAWPFFTSQKYKQYRTEAIAALLREAQRQERLLYDDGAYANFAAYVTDSTRVDNGRGLYTISINIPDPCPVGAGEVCYTLTATPVAGLPQADDAGCTSFTLDHRGKRGSTGSFGNCWSQ